MKVVDEFGDHRILDIDIAKHKFKEFFNKLYCTDDMSSVHLGSDYYKTEGIGDVETQLHKKFYEEIKSNDTFKRLYCTLIKEIHVCLFPSDKYLIYQSYPSIRFQFINNVAVPPHYDSDKIGNHPIGEKNFLLPITDMFGSKRLFIESKPRVRDFRGVDLKYGQLFYFNGNTCTHHNQKNIEDSIRVSLDFRVIRLDDYIKYIHSGNITTTNPRDPDKIRKPTKMTIGNYYQQTLKSQTVDEMMKWDFVKDKIPQTRPSFGDDEANACRDYILEGGFVTEYTKTSLFEQELSNYIGSKNCILTTSGNSAIILALMAVGVGHSDEVIVPDYTMIATVNSVKMVGAVPVFCDVSPTTFTLRLEDVIQKITPKTRAIIHVSLNNRQDSLVDLAKFCKRSGIFLIEDAAQSLGCTVENKHFGTFGDVGCFSLSSPKIISTGQGGFVVTDDNKIADKIRMIKNFGRKSGGIDVFETFGINLKFTDIQAVIGLEQFKKLSHRIDRLREMHTLYYKNIPTLMLKPPNNEWIPWFIEIFVENRQAFVTFLNAHNIETRVSYPQVSKTCVYDNIEHFPNSEFISTTGLFLPTHFCLSDDEIIFICKIINLYMSAVI